MMKINHYYLLLKTILYGYKVPKSVRRKVEINIGSESDLA